MRVLLVEDDPMIGDSIRMSLLRENHVVDWVRDGRMVEEIVLSEHFDLLLLDLGLPGKSGLEVLTALRNRGIYTPIIVVTARDGVDDRIKGLDCGADDYVAKPFDIGELEARMRSAVRRSVSRAEPNIEIHNVRLCLASKEVWLNGELVYLSGKEYAVVEALMLRPGRVLSRGQLQERLYGWNDDIGSNAIEVHIHAIRRKLGSEFIKNVRGVGYFVPKARCAA